MRPLASRWREKARVCINTKFGRWNGSKNRNDIPWVCFFLKDSFQELPENYNLE